MIRFKLSVQWHRCTECFTREKGDWRQGGTIHSSFTDPSHKSNYFSTNFPSQDSRQPFLLTPRVFVNTREKNALASKHLQAVQVLSLSVGLTHLVPVQFFILDWQTGVSALCALHSGCGGVDARSLLFQTEPRKREKTRRKPLDL